MKEDHLNLGIYLGVSKCAIARYNGINTEIFKNSEGFEFTPSAVWMDSKERLHVGRRAKDQLENDPENSFSEFKLQMGTETLYSFGRNKKKMKPQELSAEVLKSLKEDVRRQLGEDVTSVVITVPAAFELPQCKATNEAAEMAGFLNHPLLQEPIAAAMAYGFQSESSNKFWMVYDFGGGTFDASIIQIKDGQIEVVNSGGDNGLGGKNLDWEIVDSLLAPVVAKQNSLKNFTRSNKQFRGAFAKLKAEAEKAKIRLSLEESVEMHIDSLLKNDKGESVVFNYELQRSDFEKLAKPYIIKSINICKKVLMEKSMETSNIEKMIMVGGTSLIPLLREMLLDPNEGLGISLETSICPITAKVIGAALYAYAQRSFNQTLIKNNVTNKNQTMKSIEERVIDQIKLISEKDEIGLNDNLRSVISEDELVLIETFIEDEFNLEILSLDGELDNVKKVSDLVKLVKSKTDKKDFGEAVLGNNEVVQIQPVRSEEKISDNSVFSTNPSAPQPKLDCEILIQAAAPDIYRINAFRISGLNVNATTREISNQVQKNQMMEKYGGKMDNHKSPFPIQPPPDIDKLRQALHRLRDPETRLIDEFFWFWPHSLDSAVIDHALAALSRNEIKTAESLWINYEATLTESNVSRHNLAVLSHLLVLDMELNETSMSKEEIEKRDKYWKDTFKRWKLLLEHEGFWSRLTARVRQMDDPRLTTGFVKRMRETLPYAILRINGLMAIEFAENGKIEEAKRHLKLIQTSGFDNYLIDNVLKTVVDPVRKRIKVLCVSASDESKRDNKRGIELARQILTQTQWSIKSIKILCPENTIIIEGIEDDIVSSVFECYKNYANKTEDYVSALELINSMKNFIESDTARSKVNEKIKAIEDVLDYSNFWRLKGYFSYPSKCVDMMEKAFDLQETLKYDEAIDLLRKGLFSLSEIQESESLRKQFLHCIAYCLRRKSVKIYNEAFDEHNAKFDKIYNNLVKYRVSNVNVGNYSFLNCAHCYGMITGEYYNRTVNGVKQPFCNSCNTRIERDYKDLDIELEKEIKEALNLIQLSKYLSPDHNPTKLDFDVMKESATKRKISSAEIPDLLLKFKLLDISGTINLLTSGTGKKDSKLYSHLISIIESQDVDGRINTFNILFNSPPVLIKELQPYFFSVETIFHDFVKFVFGGQYNITAGKQQDILNDILRMDNYIICIRLLNILGILNDQQKFIERIINRLFEFIHEIIAKNSFDEISFKFGELGDIVQSTSQISEDLKNKCIFAIISSASKDQNKALKVISTVYEDKQVEQLFFQILYSNDPLFDKQTRIQYYEYLLGHWDSTIRKKSVEWLNANITDNQVKIKILIKSLADPDNSIQSYARELISKHPEEASELLLEACYTSNAVQLFNIRALLKTILFNLNWKSPKAISLKSLIRICLTHKDKEISQLIFNVIDKFHSDWATSKEVKSCLKNIKYVVKKEQGHHAQIANEMLVKISGASFGSRLLIFLSGKEQLSILPVPNWCQLEILENAKTAEINTFISSGNETDDLFNKLKKFRNKIKPVKINGFSKICYGHQISPDGSVLVLSVYKEKKFKYDWQKEKSSVWDLYSLDLKSGNLKCLFYLEFDAYHDIEMLENSFYSMEPSKNIVCWNWRNTSDFKFSTIVPDKYQSAYPHRFNNDLLVGRFNDNKREYFSLKNNFRRINFFTAKNEGISCMHTLKNYILISKRPAKSDGWPDFDAPVSYLLITLNDSLSENSRQEVLKESYKGEISNINFYGENQIIYKRKNSKNSKKTDIYVQDLDNINKYQKIIQNLDYGSIWSKPGYILYTNYTESTKSTDLIIHKVSSGESIKLITLTGEGYRNMNVSEDWSTVSYLHQTESGDSGEVPCNIFLVNLDLDKNFKDDICIKSEDNSYVRIAN